MLFIQRKGMPVIGAISVFDENSTYLLISKYYFIYIFIIIYEIIIKIIIIKWKTKYFSIISAPFIIKGKQHPLKWLLFYLLDIYNNQQNNYYDVVKKKITKKQLLCGLFFSQYFDNLLYLLWSLEVLLYIQLLLAVNIQQYFFYNILLFHYLYLHLI